MVEDRGVTGMYYSDELVEEVRSRNDIVDVVGSYVRLTKKGSSYFGLCPFHSEKTGSFSVTPSKQMYYCFGCGKGGNVFTFLMEQENMSFTEAIQELAQRAGVELPEGDRSEEAKREAGRRSRILEINREAAKYYYYMLRNENGKLGMDYLTGRKLTEETMRRFGLGYAGQGKNSLVNYLRSKGYPDELIRASGLVNVSEKYGMSDKFWNRVIFPIQDVKDRVIGFGGRVMGTGEPKYLNSPETEVFDKGRNLYGLNHARKSKRGNIILCEGYMDVISMHQAGFDQAVASLGTAFTAGQASLLHKYTEEVLLIYDSDEAGIKAATRAIPILKQAGIRAKVVNLRPYKDPDEFIKNEGREAFQERLDKADNSFFFEIRILERNYHTEDPEEKTEFYRAIAKRLCEFAEDLERNNYLEAIASRYGIPSRDLQQLVIKYAAEHGFGPLPEKPKTGVNRKKPEEGGKQVQKILLTWLTDEPGLYPKIAPYITPEDFTEELYHTVAVKLFDELKEGKINPAAMISMFPDEAEQSEVAALFNTKIQYIDNQQEREKAFHDVLYKVKQNSYESMQQRLGADIGALQQVIAGKKALEELAKVHISFD